MEEFFCQSSVVYTRAKVSLPIQGCGFFMPLSDVARLTYVLGIGQAWVLRILVSLAVLIFDKVPSYRP